MEENRQKEILNQIIFWASQVIHDDIEFYKTAVESWGLTAEECEELDIKRPDFSELTTIYEVVVKDGVVIKTDEALLKYEKSNLYLKLGKYIARNSTTITHDMLEDILDKYNEDHDNCLWSFCAEDFPQEIWGSNTVIKVTINGETRYYEVD